MGSSKIKNRYIELSFYDDKTLVIERGWTEKKSGLGLKFTASKEIPEKSKVSVWVNGRCTEIFRGGANYKIPIKRNSLIALNIAECVPINFP